MQSSQLVDIANKIDANFINGCRLGSGINGSAIIEDDFTTHFTSLYTVPWMNVVLKADGNMPDLTQRVKDVLSKFQVPMTWRLGPLSTATDTIKETLQSLGLVESTWQEPGMRLDLEK
ncbi:MAG: hypothetical protein K2Z81_18840, partial [Cyanobacteria bacterium]|nr:hypothetical protein [Cyanobacteriota bacterium]